MNRIYYYPAVFQKEDDGYSVWLYDIEGCVSQGDTLDEATNNITEAVGLFFEGYQESGKEIPKATSPEKINLKKDQFVALVGFDWTAYQAKYGNKAVKKTLSIPSWLNTMAEEKHINFSSVLQNALKEQLQVTDI